MYLLLKLKRNLRLCVQIAFTAFTNGYVNGYLEHHIFRGSSKKLCAPGLNCYSCPGALGSCPIGSLQAVLGSPHYHFSFYVIGFLMAFGSLFGRLICGFLCPFGLVEDLLHKLPFPYKLRKVPGNRLLKYLKYLVLVFFVLLLPAAATNIAGIGTPWFCKWICPSGTLFGGIPLVLGSSALRSAIGFLFQWKVALLLILLFLSILIYRPFCRYLCPLGAIYGCLHKISLYRYEVEEEKCIHCKKCQQACEFDIPVYQTPNSPECIRCGKCKDVCPTNAIRSSMDQLYETFYHRAKKNHAG